MQTITTIGLDIAKSAAGTDRGRVWIGRWRQRGRHHVYPSLRDRTAGQ
jgi:hypothetical protein